MSAKPTLLVLAAGMGSRYGGLKQLDAVGPGGETIVDFSVYDALRAGFGKVVFVVRRDFEDRFRELVTARFAHRIDVALAFQELGALPAGFEVPANRDKPWGTGHAVLVAEDEVDGPFAVVNADDFYGARSFEIMADFLGDAEAADTWAMVGFPLRETLSPHGGVNRGICEVDGEGRLLRVVERYGVVADDDGARVEGDDLDPQRLAGDALTSMNFWGLTPSVFERSRQGFEEFLSASHRDPEAEFGLPIFLDELVERGAARVRVLPGGGPWFGVTYPEDRERVTAAVRDLVEGGAYPLPLWG